MTIHDSDPDRILARVYRLLIRRVDTHWYREGYRLRGSAAAGRLAGAENKTENPGATPEQNEEEDQTP